MESTLQKRPRHAQVIVAATAMFAVLYWARDLLIPIALAIFLAFLLAPLVRRVQGWGLPRIPGVLVVVTLACTFIGVGGWFVASRAIGLAGELPKYRENIGIKVRALRESVGGRLRPVSQVIDAVTGETRSSADRSHVVGPPNNLSDSAGEESQRAAHVEPIALIRTGLVPLLHPFGVVGLAAVYVVFFLIFREDLRDRVIRVCGDVHIDLTTAALSDAGTRVSRYFGGMVLANGLHGTAVAVGLMLLGIPNAVVFGVLAALLRFVPFLGPIIAAVLPTTLALALTDGWTTPVLVVALFVVVDLLSANMLEPWLYGARTGASPTAIILSTVVWTWLWGAIGLILATPITVCLVVLGKYVAPFQVFYVLLGDEPVLEPHARFYQRLLALDKREASQIVRSAARDLAPEKVMSELVVAALAMMAVGDVYGSQNAGRELAASEVVNDLLDELHPVPEVRTSTGGAAGQTTLVIPVHGPLDEIGGRILARIFESHGGAVRVASPHMLIAELLEGIVAETPRTICLVSVNAADIGRAELLCRRLSDAGVESSIIVGVWDATADLERVKRRLGRFSAVNVFATLAATLQALEACAPPRRLESSAVGEGSTVPAVPAISPG